MFGLRVDAAVERATTTPSIGFRVGVLTNVLELERRGGRRSRMKRVGGRWSVERSLVGFSVSRRGRSEDATKRRRRGTDIVMMREDIAEVITWTSRSRRDEIISSFESIVRSTVGRGSGDEVEIDVSCGDFRESAMETQ